MADADRELVGHDLKEVLRLLPREAPIEAARFDTLLASYLVRTSSHGHPFEELAFEKLGAQPRSAKETGFDKGQIPPLGDQRLAAFAGERIELLARLVPMLRAELAATSAGRVYREIEAPLTPVLLRMEETGILLDVPYLAAMSEAMAAELATLEEEIFEFAGERFNIQSPQQLGTILFEKLGMKARRRTQKTKSWSTDADTLAELAAEGHPLPDRLLRYRGLSKLKGTYTDKLPRWCIRRPAACTRNYAQAVAVTGRLSSNDPTCRTSRCAPPRAGASARRSSRRPGSKIVSRRLLADRAAHHGAPLGRREPAGRVRGRRGRAPPHRGGSLRHRRATR